MPTYKNNGTNKYIIANKHIISGSIDFGPGASVETAELLDKLSDVERTADTPYYNPILARHDLTLVGVTTTELVLTYPLKTTTIIVRDASTNLDIRVNGADNLPGTPIMPDEILEISADKNIDKLYITHSADATLTIIEA